MAREAVLKFNPEARIVAHHGNVKESKFGMAFIRKFDLVLNALDNVDARRYSAMLVFWINELMNLLSMFVVELAFVSAGAGCCSLFVLCRRGHTASSLLLLLRRPRWFRFSTVLLLRGRPC